VTDLECDGQAVFVCGLGRCGTTWIARSLAQSPELVYVGEAWLIEKLDELLRWHGVLLDEWGDFTTWHKHGIGRDAFVRAIARLYNDVLSIAAGGRRFVEKTPEWNVFHLPLLAELFPEARFVLSYRDGRNYVASVEAKRRTAGKEFAFEDYCRRWAQGMEAFEQVGRGGRPRFAHLVRYEDLLEDFDGTFANLCDFVGIERIVAQPLAPNSAFPNRETIQDFTTRWHGWSSEQRELFRRHAGKELVRWGYVDSKDGW
jgi:hypothetical protein